MSERIFNVSRSTKTGKTVNVGDFPTVEQAQASPFLFLWLAIFQNGL
jgi:hypothetical protein